MAALPIQELSVSVADQCRCGCIRGGHKLNYGYCTTPHCPCVAFVQRPRHIAGLYLGLGRDDEQHGSNLGMTESELMVHAEQKREAEHARRGR